MNIKLEDVCGVILAGGRGQRMGGRDKGLVPYQGQPLVKHVIDKLQPQLKSLIININRNQRRYQEFELTLCSDRYPNYQGPLAGIASAFDCSVSDYLLFSPCDTPNLPKDLVERLIATANQQQKKLVITESPSGTQPLCCLIHRSLRPSLSTYLESGERRVQGWTQQQDLAICKYDEDDFFFNINTLQTVEDESLNAV